MSREIISAVLRAAQIELQDRVVPELQNEDGRLVAVMVGDLLGLISAWHEEPPEDFVTRCRALRALVPLDKEISSSSGLVSGYSNPAEVIQALIEKGLDDAGFAKAAIHADRDYFAEEYRLRENGLAEARERLESVEVDLTVERANRLIIQCLGDGHRVRTIRRAAGGMSKDSFFLAYTIPSGEERKAVLRRDLPFGPAGTTVTDEFDLLTQLADRGVLVARPLGCDGSCIVGQPSMLVAHVPGDSGTNGWEAEPLVAADVCRQVAQVMASLHVINPSDIGLESAADQREHVRNYILFWRQRWRENRLEPSPTVALGFEWLLDNVPDQVDRLTIVHGDIGFHNIMIDKGQVQALIDWEFAHVGDPVEDLSYVKPFIERFLRWSEFLACYQEAGGGDYMLQNAQFYDVWRNLRNTVTCATAWKGFVEARYPALKMAYQGVSLYRLFQELLAKEMAERF